MCACDCMSCARVTEVCGRMQLESANGVSEVEWDGLDDEEVTEVTETLGGMSLGGGAVQGWTDQERRLVQPSIELIRVS